MTSRQRFVVMLVVLWGCSPVSSSRLPVAVQRRLVLENCADIPWAFSEGNGLKIVLPAKECRLSSVLKVPNGAEVSGQPETHLIGDFPSQGQSFPIFDVSRSTDINIHDFTITLGAYAKAIFGEESQRVRISNLTISGDRKGPGISSLPIYFEGAQEIVIEGNRISDSYGGIYTLRSKDISIRGNLLTQVNHGNVVVSGENITIENNSIKESGSGGPNLPLGGDGITIGEHSRKIYILKNQFLVGHCYLLSAFEGLTDFEISENGFSESDTHALQLYKPRDGKILNNRFNRNRSDGIAIEFPSNITMEGNRFFEDRLVINSSEGANRIVNNLFVKPGVTSMEGLGNSDLESGNQTIR